MQQCCVQLKSASTLTSLFACIRLVANGSGKTRPLYRGTNNISCAKSAFCTIIVTHEATSISTRN